MKYMGIDYGRKRVGVAISDDDGNMSFPYSVLENNTTIIEHIKKICVDKNVSAVVIGESRDFKGKPNTIMQESVDFSEKLKKQTGISIFFEPEFLTSREASHIQGETDLIDSSAAALILQSFINKKHKQTD
jgi:putative holliday junction resolvase